MDIGIFLLMCVHPLLNMSNVNIGIQNCCLSKTRQHMQFHGFCDPLGSTYSTKTKWKGKTIHMHYSIRLTSIAKYFHMWKRFVPIVNIQHQIFKKLLMCFITFFGNIFGTKRRCDCTPNWPRPFFPWFLTMICFISFFSNDQLSLSNQSWMCIFNVDHRKDPIKLVEFDKTILYSRLLA